MVTASVAWELAEVTKGRFRLGLGTQVRAHIERRYGSPFDHPGTRLQDYIAALRAVFAAFRGERPLDYHSEFWDLSLLPDIWSPGPIDVPDPPIDVAAVNPWMLEMAARPRRRRSRSPPEHTRLSERDSDPPPERRISAGGSIAREPRTHRARLRRPRVDPGRNRRMAQRRPDAGGLLRIHPQLRLHLRPARPARHDGRGSANARRPATWPAWLLRSTTTCSITSA